MFVVGIGIISSFEAARNALGFTGLERSSLVGANFVNSSSLGGSFASGLNSINVGAVAGASVSSAGGLDTAIFAALGVFLVCALYLLLDKKALRV